MRFKSIMLQGFKSFVDKTIVEFPDGITCVVGPNGSGKSNIMDAIRWVFGEQSPKELRGNDMEDVIFGGSSKRKASGFAEVSLTVSELPESVTSKWGTLSEVMITRKFYRSGEREYRINNRKCRLKDIREIFYDTGMGARSISIIEQGKVEKIIQATPEDLRLFLEETAGVVRFKERKKEAEKRLHQTKDNQGRVNDIISEIRSHIETLTRQVEMVNKFREFAGRKTQLEKNIILHKYLKLKDDGKAIDDEINREKEGMSSIIAEFEKLVKIETEKALYLSSLRGAFREANEKMLFLGDSIANISGDLRQLESEIAGAESAKERLQLDIEEFEGKITELTNTRTTLNEKRKETEENKSKLRESLDELEEKIEEYTRMKDDLSYDINELEDEYMSLTQKLTTLTNQVFEKETSINSLNADKKRFTLEKDDLEAETASAVKRAEDAQREYEEAGKSLKTLTAEIKELKSELSDIRTLEEDAKSERDALRLHKNSLESRISVLKEQIENAAVGSSGEYLKRFESSLLIDRMDDPQNAPMHMADILVFKSEEKSMVIATVREMKGSLRFTFSDVAHEVLADINKQEKVTENIIKTGALYSKAGDDDKGAVILKLKSELSASLTKLKGVTDEYETADARYEGLADSAEELAETLTEKEALKNSIESEAKNASRVLDEAIAIKEKLSRRGEIIEKETEFVIRELERAENDLVKLKADRSVTAEKQKEKEEEKQLLEERLEDVTTLYEDAKDELNAFKIEERGFTEQLNAITREINASEREITETSNKITSARDKLNRLVSVDIISFTERLENKKEEYAKLMKEQQELRSTALSTDKEVAENEKELEDLKKEIDKINREIVKLRSTVTEAELKRERILTEMSTFKEVFNDKFDSDIDEDTTDLSGFQPNKAKTELDAVTKLIEELGPLNMAAEQEYEEISKRNEFLTQQRADLEDAIASIYELISEIDDNTAALFKSTFEGVRDNFKRVFDILFGDGMAELRLSEPDNVLTSGVEIFVQPPGKKLVNMNLLSGGEKAMSACTLLFALFLYKPTPFCFLDEIDAPLDEANIDKFMKVVKTLSDDTQFVIITHSQKTMAEADSLYGVTMQEPGVSKILSVRLSDLKL
jgi:chromosome segregation protein